MTDLVVTRLITTPIKGLRVHEPEQIVLGPHGADGDRDFLLVGPNDRIISLKLAGALVRMRAEYDPQAGRLAVTDADGTTQADTVRTGEPVAARRFDDSRLPTHEVLGPWSELFSDAAGRSLRLVKTDEPGTGSDVEPVTLLGEGSLDELGRRSGLGAVDPRRFRMLIQFASSTPHVEDTWNGQVMSVGEARLRVGGAVPRCAATTRHPERGDQDAPILRAIRDYRGVVPTAVGDGVPFGVYADVIAGGRVRVGDRIEVEPSRDGTG